MKLYLVRHGQAVAETIDPQRPLSDQGKLEIKAIAKFLAKQNLNITNIFHSNKLRAKQTAEIIQSKIKIKGALLSHQNISPDDPVLSFAKEINKFHADHMAVGHLPFLAKLVSKLIGINNNEEIINMPTGGVICLEQLAKNWAIKWIIIPSLFQ